MIRQGWAALTLLAIVGATVEPAAAQDTTGRRASLFELGIYSGGAWTTDWCVGADGGGVFGNSHFAELHPFDVNWSGVIGGVYGGVRVPVSPNIAIGGRVGVLFSSADGTHRPFPLFEVKVKSEEIFYVDLEAVFNLSNLLSNGAERRGYPPPTVSAFVGPAFGQVNVTGTSIGTPFSFSDTQGVLGFTAGGRIEVPILPNISATGTIRYIHLPAEDFSFPGTAAVDSDILAVTGGLKFSFTSPPPNTIPQFPR